MIIIAGVFLINFIMQMYARFKLLFFWCCYFIAEPLWREDEEDLARYPRLPLHQSLNPKPLQNFQRPMKHHHQKIMNQTRKRRRKKRKPHQEESPADYHVVLWTLHRRQKQDWDSALNLVQSLLVKLGQNLWHRTVAGAIQPLDQGWGIQPGYHHMVQRQPHLKSHGKLPCLVENGRSLTLMLFLNRNTKRNMINKISKIVRQADIKTK